MCLAIPGRLESIEDDDPLMRRGRVRFGGVVREIHLALVPEAEPGDDVLVHVGVALSVIDRAEADRLRALLESIGEASPDDHRTEPGTRP
ncbi:MAG: HypC/HybG/HupF family hydrogenase formation chaperone [Armatimonadota bacterium]